MVNSNVYDIFKHNFKKYWCPEKPSYGKIVYEKIYTLSSCSESSRNKKSSKLYLAVRIYLWDINKTKHAKYGDNRHGGQNDESTGRIFELNINILERISKGFKRKFIGVLREKT